MKSLDAQLKYKLHPKLEHNLAQTIFFFQCNCACLIIYIVKQKQLVLINMQLLNGTLQIQCIINIQILVKCWQSRTNPGTVALGLTISQVINARFKYLLESSCCFLFRQKL